MVLSAIAIFNKQGAFEEYRHECNSKTSAPTLKVLRSPAAYNKIAALGLSNELWLIFIKLAPVNTRCYMYPFVIF